MVRKYSYGNLPSCHVRFFVPCKLQSYFGVGGMATNQVTWLFGGAGKAVEDSRLSLEGYAFGTFSDRLYQTSFGSLIHEKVLKMTGLFSMYNIMHNIVYNIMYNIMHNIVYNIMYNTMYNIMYYIMYNIMYHIMYHILYNVMIQSQTNKWGESQRGVQRTPTKETPPST